MNSRNLMRIVTAIIALLFVVSWITKSTNAQTESTFLSVRDGFLVTFAVFLTLSVFSFLYRDNPFYKFAEHLYVGISAAYWMSLGFWTTIVGNVVPRLSKTLSAFFHVPFSAEGYSYQYFIPIIFGLILLTRLLPRIGWLSRWSLAFIIGGTAGMNLPRYLQSDFTSQISNSFIPLLVDWKGVGRFFSDFSLSIDGQFIAILSNWVIFAGVMCGLVYFFFSKEHKGAFGVAARVGIWILMITFGASFGYTVMGRISLLVGRITFLFGDWLHIL